MFFRRKFIKEKNYSNVRNYTYEGTDASIWHNAVTKPIAAFLVDNVIPD